MKAGIFALARGSMFAIAFVAMCWSATGFAFVPRIRTGSSFQEASGYVQRSWAFPDRVHPSSRRGCSALMALKDLARKVRALPHFLVECRGVMVMSHGRALITGILGERLTFNPCSWSTHIRRPHVESFLHFTSGALYTSFAPGMIMIDLFAPQLHV